jgi:hypothetical protein
LGRMSFTVTSPLRGCGSKSLFSMGIISLLSSENETQD